MRRWSSSSSLLPSWLARWQRLVCWSLWLLLLLHVTWASAAADATPCTTTPPTCHAVLDALRQLQQQQQQSSSSRQLLASPAVLAHACVDVHTRDGVVRHAYEHTSYTCLLAQQKTAPQQAAAVARRQQQDAQDEARVDNNNDNNNNTSDAAHNLTRHVVLLLGVPEAAAQAPLYTQPSLHVGNVTHHYARTHAHARYTYALHNDDDDDDDDDDGDAAAMPRAWPLWSLLRTTRRQLRRVASRVVHYPWYSPAALARVYCQRELYVSFPVQQQHTQQQRRRRDGNDDDDDDEDERYVDTYATRDYGARYSRAVALSEGALHRLRVVSFPPTLLYTTATATARSAHGAAVRDVQHDNNDGDGSATWSSRVQMVCDYDAVHAARRHVRQQQQRQQRRQAPHDLLDDDDDDDAADAHDRYDARSGRRRASTGAGSDRRRGTLLSQLMRWLLQRLVATSFARRHALLSSSSPAHATTASGVAARWFGRHATRVSPSQRAAVAFVRATREELGPAQPPQSLLPSRFAQWLGTRTLCTRQQLLERAVVQGTRGATSAQNEQQQQQQVRAAATHATQTRYAAVSSSPRVRYEYWFRVVATLPAARSVCVMLQALPPPRTSALDEHARRPRYTDDDDNDEDNADDYTSTTATTTATSTLPLHIEERVRLDTTWLRLVLVLCALHVARPHLERSGVAHFVMAALCGVAVLLALLVAYVWREVRHMSVGKAGLLMLLAVGGVAAVTEGVLSAAVQLLYALEQPLWRREWALYSLLVVLLLGVVSSLLIRLLLPASVLRTATRWGLRATTACVLLLAWASNHDATALTLTLWLLLRLWRWWQSRRRRRKHSGDATSRQQQQQQQAPPASSSTLQTRDRGNNSKWPSVVAGTRQDGGSGRRSSSSSDARLDALNEPADQLPATARRTQAFVRPLVEEAARYVRPPLQQSSSRSAAANNNTTTALTHSQKMRLYEDEGAAHTRRALEALAARVRTSDGQYAHRLRDPNSVHRWAGGVQHRRDDGSSSNDSSRNDSGDNDDASSSSYSGSDRE